VGQKYVVKGLIAQVKLHLDIKRQVTDSYAWVLGVAIATQAVTMGTTGTNVDRPALAADITTLLNNYIPNQKLYLSQLTALATGRGAEDSAVSLPAAFPVTPAAYTMIRPGNITVT
jgi:hypothetical protein